MAIRYEGMSLLYSNPLKGKMLQKMYMSVLMPFYVGPTGHWHKIWLPKLLFLNDELHFIG